MKITTKEIAITAVLTAMTCVLSPISIPIGPVPISLGLFCIFITGAMLPPQLAVMSTLVYILLGSVGVPIFTGFEGGFQKLIGPTGGFIVAYPFMALIIALSVVIFKKRNAISIVVGIIVSLILCYALGTVWFIVSMRSTVKTALTLCVTPFIVVDLIKLVCATVFSLAANKALSKANIRL